MTAFETIQQDLDILLEQIEQKRNELDGLTEKYRDLCNKQFEIIHSLGAISDEDFSSLAGF